MPARRDTHRTSSEDTDMIKLYGRATSGNVQKVIFLLEELGQPYERLDYGRQFGNTGTPEYLAMNPTNKVPTRFRNRKTGVSP